MSELLLGIDIGTASSKGVLVRADGDVIASANRAHKVSMPRPGWVEHDADKIWWADAVSLCRELTEAADADIAAMGVSGIGPCVVPCDSQDRPLRPAILYGVDTRATEEVQLLAEMLGSEEILQRAGSALSSQALGPKLLWLERNEADVWAGMRRWHMASSLVVARLTGEWVLDHHSASQCDPFYDLDASAWNRQWVESVLPGLPLPRLAWPSEIVGTVHARGAEATGLAAGTPVIAGTIDSWAEAASAGVRNDGDLMLQYGSTVFLILVDGRPARRESIWTTRGVDPGSLTLAAGLATAGSLAAWVRELVGAPTFEALTREAEYTAPGGEGLLILPYFAGERTPILDPQARGTITGLSLRHNRGDLYRAVLESIAFGIRHNLETMTPSGHVRAVAVGGGTKADLWPQIVSDVTGLPQEVPEISVGACYGDALLAAEGAGLVPPRSSWARSPRLLSPNLETEQLYTRLYGLYRELYPATRDIQHALAEIQVRGDVMDIGLPEADAAASEQHVIHE